MKTTRITLLVLSIFWSMTFVACREELPIKVSISEEEAADLITYAISSETAGMVTQVEASAELAEAYVTSIPCGEQKDSSLVFQSNASSRFTYDYEVNWSWALTCNLAGIPDSFVLDFDVTGDYETLRMNSSDQTDYAMSLTGLKLSEPELIYNGTIGRSGSQESKARNQSTFDSELKIQVTNITYSKSDLEISGGNAKAELQVTHNNGTQQTFTGDITFLGGNAATLVLNGMSFNLTW